MKKMPQGFNPYPNLDIAGCSNEACKRKGKCLRFKAYRYAEANNKMIYMGGFDGCRAPHYKYFLSSENNN